MNYFKKQWESFKQKSLFGKLADVGFYLLIIFLFIPDGRMLVQRGLLETGLFGSTAKNESFTISTKTKNWQLIDLDGEAHSFSSLSQKPVFLNFWATWCPPCKAEMPAIEETFQALGNQVQFVLVSNESPEKVRAFIKSAGYSFPVYTIGSQIPDELFTQSLPTTFVINKQQKVVHRSEGMRKWDKKAVLELLNEEL